jgi:fumarate reductase subunit D
MLPGAGPAMMRAAAVIPVVLLVLFTGLLWLLGLICGRERRRYVTDLSQQAMGAIGTLMHGPAIPVQPANRQGPQPGMTPP